MAVGLWGGEGSTDSVPPTTFLEKLWGLEPDGCDGNRPLPPRLSVVTSSGLVSPRVYTSEEAVMFLPVPIESLEVLD